MEFIILIPTKYMGMFKLGFRVHIVNDPCVILVENVMKTMLLSYSSHSTMCYLLPHPQLPIGPCHMWICKTHIIQVRNADIHLVAKIEDDLK